MTSQLIGSVLVGLAVSAVLFLPLVVWQYRRYGRFDALRMLWTSAGFVYASAIVAFTVFPLPDFGPGYCEANATYPLLDPLRFPRELAEVVGRDGLTALVSSWVVWEFALNMVLFIPFGVIVRRLFEWPRGVVFAAALGTSLLVELTQLTGNWGLAPCPYRFADVTDLFTNSTGALIGLGLERITPRLLSTKAHLLAQRDRARPVRRGRRLAGMVLDTWFLTLAVVVGGTVASTLYAVGHGGMGQELTPEQMIDLERWIFDGAAQAALATVFVPALQGGGASLGQRTVHLVPTSRDGSRARLLARALVTQGVGALLVSLGIPWVLLVPPVALAALAAGCVTARGISGMLTGCGFRDARSVSEPATVRQ